MLEIHSISPKDQAKEATSMLTALFRVRYNVFVVEQNVPVDLEKDEFENCSYHVLASWDGVAAGTARWRKTTEGVKLERFAVLNKYRGNRIGIALVEYTLTECRKYIDKDTPIYLNAQESAVQFYVRFGFKVVGEPFDEAGIIHYRMEL